MAKNIQKSAILAREKKALRVVDWMMSPANKDIKAKLQAAEFILKRIYPERHEIEHSGQIKFTPEERDERIKRLKDALKEERDE
jgi:hypothetical protein